MTERGKEIRPEAYQQNYEQFRSLNQIMWQIPVLAMTLTGGLWFGVSQILDTPLLVSVLLVTAAVGNITFIAVLHRFRHVMQCYLDWLKEADRAAYVDASPSSEDTGLGSRLARKNMGVRTLFSAMLGWAAAGSIILLVGYWIDRGSALNMNRYQSAIEYYDRYATALADSYEAVAFERAYPFLINRLSQGSLRIADIGAGTGRDAAWLADHGHTVTAIEPSQTMLTLAQRLHPRQEIQWVSDRLPSLRDAALRGTQFDLVLINAVWMHIAPADRRAALDRILELLEPNGSAFVSLRLGPADAARGMHPIDPSDFVLTAEDAGFEVLPQGDFPDILGRPEISWKVFELRLIQ